MCDKELSQRAKEYFAQIRKTDRLIQRLTSTVATLRSSLTSQSYELKPDKVQSSGAKNPFDRIRNVPDLDQQNILIGRYIQLKNWDDVAAELNFSIKWTIELHGKALLAFAKGNPQIFEGTD